MNWQSGDMESRRERRLRAAEMMRNGYRAALADENDRTIGQPLVNLASLPNGARVKRWWPRLETHPHYRVGRELPDYARLAGVNEASHG
jgi:hypothetical protein